MTEGDAATTAAAPTPRPGLVRAVGVLNLLVGGVLSLVGLVLLGFIAPGLVRNHPLQVDPAEAEAVLGEMREGLRADLRVKEQATPAGPQRAAYRKALDSLDRPRGAENRRPGSGVDYARLNADLPWLAAYLWADLLTGPILNLLTAVSGIGLMRIQGWGRRLAVSVSVLKVCRLAALGVLLAAAVVPRSSRTLGQFVHTEVGAGILSAALDQQGARPGVGPVLNITPDEFLGMLTALGYAYALIGFAFGSVYPAAVLAALCRPESRGAVAGPPPPERITEQ